MVFYKLFKLKSRQRWPKGLPNNIMGSNTKIKLSIKSIKKEIKKIELLLEYKEKKKLINKIMEIKHEESESESESDSESESESESESD